MANSGYTINNLFLQHFYYFSDKLTISDFRKDNAEAIKKVFKAFVKFCIKLNLYQRELIVIDGSKFRAVNNKRIKQTKRKE